MKRFLKKAWVQKTLSFLIYKYLHFVWKTSRFSTFNEEQLKGLLDQHDSVLVCFWHRHMAMGSFAWTGQTKNFYMLISEHSDGRLISDVVSYFRIKTIKGSLSKGGMIAARQMIRLLKNGQTVGITPDGPRGPGEKIKEGIYTLSYLSQKPVIALSFDMSRKKVLSSWDRFIIPLPFSKGAFCWTTPKINVASKTNKDAFLDAVQTALDEAQNFCQKKI